MLIIFLWTILSMVICYNKKRRNNEKGLCNQNYNITHFCRIAKVYVKRTSSFFQ